MNNVHHKFPNPKNDAFDLLPCLIQAETRVIPFMM